LDEENSKHAWFGAGKWFWLSIIAQFVVAAERCSEFVDLEKRM
jgi:hypothetical protein